MQPTVSKGTWTMRNHDHQAGADTVHHHFNLDDLTWPIVTGSVATWPVWPWFDILWHHAPTPTAVYMVVSAAFMLFQIADKMGWLERFKRKPALLPNAPDDPEG